MELKVIRTHFGNNYTIGKLHIDNTLYCDTLEDTSRQLSDKMSAAEIAEKKIKARTAIPTGNYSIYMTFSPKFKRDMPLINGVKCYEGVRIHAGNTDADTEGCILVGRAIGGALVRSRDHFEPLRDRIIAAIAHGEAVNITIIENR